MLMGYCRFEDVLPLRECRKKSNLPNNPKTVIVLLFPYYVGGLEDRNIARYTTVNDYHTVAGDILENTRDQLCAAFPGEDFVCFVDDSPVREVCAAAAAGLGAIGRNGLLIHREFGSLVFIGEIVTSLELKPKINRVNYCRSCGRCISACPTGALQKDKSLNRQLCLSYITQKTHSLSDWEAAEIRKGGFAWGCDVCQDVCPANENIPFSPVKPFYEDILPVLTFEDLSFACTKKPCGWRGQDVLLRNLNLL